MRGMADASFSDRGRYFVLEQFNIQAIVEIISLYRRGFTHSPAFATLHGRRFGQKVDIGKGLGYGIRNLFWS